MREPLYWLVATLLLIDVAFIVIHLGYADDHKRWWDLGEDWSVAEIFQYMKEAFASVALFVLYRRHRQIILLGWSGIFAFLTVDDSFQGHEKVGGRITRFFDIPNWENSPFGSIRGQDFGEIIAALIFVAPMLLVLAYGYGRANRDARLFSWRLFLLTGFLAFAGVAIDFIVNAMDDEFVFLMEDGNEMFAMSLVAWLVALALVHRNLRTGFALPFPLFGLRHTDAESDEPLAAPETVSQA